jgi:FkbM family methyltransferase
MPSSKTHRIGAFELEVPRRHALPRYQREFSTYDRFVVVLGRALPAGTVIDVGANIGDSIAALASGGQCSHFVAVEPDPAFGSVLARNIERMKRQRPDLNVETVTAFVSDSLPITGLVTARGTARATVGDEPVGNTGPRNLSLDTLVSELALDDVVLVKSDTDGFDWSVLDSGAGLLRHQQPLLFFECEVGARGEHLERYASSWERLKQAGYDHFFVFDNFGAPIGEFSGGEAILPWFEYIAAQNCGLVHRTIFYFDVLAVPSRHADVARLAWRTYRETLGLS